MSFFAGFVNGVFQGKDWREARDDRKRKREWEIEDREHTLAGRGRTVAGWGREDEERARADQEKQEAEASAARVRESRSRADQPREMSVLPAAPEAQAAPAREDQPRQRGALSVMPGLGDLGTGAAGLSMGEAAPQGQPAPRSVPLSMGETVPQQQAAAAQPAPAQKPPVQMAEAPPPGQAVPADVQRGAEIAGVQPYVPGQQRGFNLNNLIASPAAASTMPEDRPGMTEGRPYTGAELPPRQPQSAPIGVSDAAPPPDSGQATPGSPAPSRTPEQQAEQRARAADSFSFNLGGAEMNISRARKKLTGTVADTAAEIAGAFDESGQITGSLKVAGDAASSPKALSAADAVSGRKPPKQAEVKAITANAVRRFESTEIERHARVLEQEEGPEAANTWRQWAKSENARKGLEKLTEATMYWNMRDEGRALQAVIDLYNMPGYYEDGLSVLPEGTAFEYDDQGNISGLNVTFRDEATGNVLQQSIKGPGDQAFAIIIGALTPEATFEAGQRAIGEMAASQQQGVPRDDISILSTFIDEEGFERGRTRDGRIVPLVDENGRPVQRTDDRQARSRAADAGPQSATSEASPPPAAAPAALPPEPVAPAAQVEVPKNEDGIPMPRSREEFEALPSGAEFIDPEGVKRIKP